MPEKEYKPKKLTLPDGNSTILHNQVEEDTYLDALMSGGIKPEQLKAEDYTPPAETTYLDRVANGVGYGGLGFIAGGPPLGIAMGLGAAAFPPKTPGEHAANIAGIATGGPTGRLVAKGVQMAPKLASLIRGGAGIAEAELGKAVQTGIDDGKPQGFNPFSLEGAVTGILPNAGSVISKQVNASPGVTKQRMKQFFPQLQKHLSNENLAFQGFSPEKDRVTELARNFAQKPVEAVKKQVDIKLQPFHDIVKDFEGTKVQLQQQLENFKTNPPKGLFQATQDGATQAKLMQEYETVSSKLDDYSLDLVNAEIAALQNRIALSKAKKTQAGIADVIDKRTGLKVKMADNKLDFPDQGMDQISKEQWESDYISRAREIMLSDAPKKQRAHELQLLRNEYQQGVNGFDQVMESLKIEDAKLAQDLVKSRRKALAPEINLQTNAKYKAQTKLSQLEGKIEAGKLEKKLEVVNAAEKKFYEDAKQITGVGIKDVEKSLDHFKKQFKEGALLPPEVRKLVDNSGTVDDFVNAAKKMSTQELDTAMKFLPPTEQASFKKNLGDSIIFDFFARSYDPNTKQFSRMGSYVKETGLPNLEFFTGSPDAQKRFSELAQAIDRHSNKIPLSQMTGGQMMTNMKNYAVRGVVLGGLLATFSSSKFHVENTLLNAGAASTAAIVVSIPYLVSKSMNNPKLAEEFIKFVDSGGTLSYSQLPYLATFLKKEGKPVNEEELANQQKMADDIVKSGAPMSQPQAQAPPPQQPGQAQQQPQQPQAPGQEPFKYEGNPTPEQIEVMRSMHAARSGANPQQGPQAINSPVQTQPQVSPPQPNQ